MTAIGRRSFVTGLALMAAGCAQRSRNGMVVDPDSGRMFGVTQDATLFLDPALFPNRRLKLTTRNMSADPAFDLGGTRDRLRQALSAKGYQPSDGDDYGLKVDVNVLRSSQYDADMMREFAFLGGAGGALYGAERQHAGVREGTAAGLVAGATLGAILGTYAAENVYVVLAETTFGVRRHAAKPRRIVTFDGSPRVEEWEETGYGGFREVHRVRVASYGGGRNVSQREVAGEVRARLVRAVSDVI